MVTVHVSPADPNAESTRLAAQCPGAESSMYAFAEVAVPGDTGVSDPEALPARVKVLLKTVIT